MEDSFLRVEKVTKHFGSLKAVNNVDINVKRGELVSIIGPNGAGKTTLFNLITGKISKTAGKVFFKNADISSLPSHKIIQRGIGRSFQITNILPNLSVLQNVLNARLAYRGKTQNFLIPTNRFRSEIKDSDQILERVKLLDKKESMAGNLSHGAKKKLEIGMALALEPELLLLDEPTAGMSPRETQETVDLIKELSDDRTIIFTEHDMSVVFSIAERIIVLHQGEIICEGLPEEIKDDPLVRTAYLGEAA